MPGTCLTFDDLTLGYRGRAAVHHLGGRVARGTLTAVVGANGSGKSTLMKGIAGILTPIGGRIMRDVRRIAYLPQQSDIDRTFPARVVDLVSLGLWPSRGLLGRRTRADAAALARCLASVGLTGFEDRPLDTLSGGQMQRALFARTLLQEADLILLDEPFNAVDAQTVAFLLQVVRAWVAEGRTVLCVLHDHALVRAHFPETLLLARRPVAWGPTDTVLTPAHLSEARAFEEAWSAQAGWCGPGSGPGQGRGHGHGRGDRREPGAAHG